MAASEILLLGDLILDVPEPDHWLAGIAPILRRADLVIGHLEVPHTASTEERAGDVPAPGADPAHLDALARAGIGAVSMAGNHMMDCGVPGLADTLAGLDRLGIAHAGAGMTLAEARRPALIACNGRKVALLSYNCVGPELCWATADEPGCAYVAVRASDGGPSRPQAELVEIDPASQAAMEADIRAARAVADLVVVALHKGITHRPAELAAYERPLAEAAIRAGADVVAGHHAHIVRGIELVDGRAVYHGLGNGCVVTHALTPAQDHPARAEWAERRKRMFGFEPDPAYPLAPFHPEAVNGMIGRLLWHEDGTLEPGFLPIWFEPPGRPVPAEARSAAVAAYIAQVGTAAGLPEMTFEPAENGAFALQAAPAMQHALMVATLEHIAAADTDIVPLFFAAFYQACPGERERFCNRASSEGLMVNEMLSMLLAQAAGEPWLATMMRAQVNTHHDHGDIQLEQYRLALDILIGVLCDAAGDKWDRQTDRAWRLGADRLFALIEQYY